MSTESYPDVLSRYRSLLERNPAWHPDDMARLAADEGKGVIIVLRLLRDLYEIHIPHAVDAALYAVDGPGHGHPLRSWGIYEDERGV